MGAVGRPRPHVGVPAAGGEAQVCQPRHPHPRLGPTRVRPEPGELSRRLVPIRGRARYRQDDHDQVVHRLIRPGQDAQQAHHLLVTHHAGGVPNSGGGRC